MKELTKMDMHEISILSDVKCSVRMILSTGMEF
jgi:hypothetical protein